MILVVDRNGNTIPTAAIRFVGGLRYKGGHAYQVSQAGLLATEPLERTVSRVVTLSREATLTREAATNVLTLTRERNVWDSTREVSRVGTRELSNILPVTREGTVSAGLKELTVTRDLSLPISVTAPVTREITLTRPVTGELSKPAATVTREISREITLTSTATISMSVSQYPFWTRGVNNTLSIQYYKVTGTDFDDWQELDHTPGQPLVLSVISSPTGDSFTPASVDTTGWVNGQKSITGYFHGGSGSGEQVLRIYDPELNLSVDALMALNAAQTTRNPDQCFRFFGSDTAHASSDSWDDYNDYEPDDWDPQASSLWAGMQSDIRANFLADTTPGSTSASGTVASHYLVDQYNYLWASGSLYGGYVRIPISDTDKQNLVSTHLRIVPRCYIDSWSWPGIGWTREFTKYRNRFSLKIKLAEYAPATAWELANMTMPEINLNFSQVVQMIQQQGGAYNTDTDIYLSIDKSIIANLTGNYLYVWVYVNPIQNCPYTYPYFKSTMGTGPYGYVTRGSHYVLIKNVRVELTK